MSVSVACPSCMAVTALVAPASAAGDRGTFRINDEQVSGPEFLRRIGLLLGLAGAFYVVIAYALVHEREWAREAIMLFWAVPIAFGIGFESPAQELAIGCSVVISIVGAILSWYYLYRSPRVVAYFESLKTQIC